MSLINSATRLIALVLLAVSLCSCAGVTKPLTAERPKDEAFRTVLKMEPSTVTIPIEVSTVDLGKVINQAVRKELYKGSTKTKGVSADVVRNGSIVVTATDNYLYIALPINLTLSYGMFETKAIPLHLSFKATASVTPDWKLHTEINYQGLSDQLAEDVRIGPLSFKPRSIVDGITQPIQRIISDLVAQKINDAFPLKPQIVKVWNSAQKPVLLNKSYNAWLKLTPQAVMLYPLSAQNNVVKLSVGISTFAELVVGPEPVTAPLRPLPNLTLVRTFDKNFRISLNADLFYKELRSIALAGLRGKKFDSEGKSITIKDFDLYGSGDHLVVKLETLGSLEGVFYLTAKPVFDAKTNVFSVENVDFEMQTRDLLLQSADWFLHGTIRSTIQEKLNMDLTQRVEQTRKMAGEALAKVPLVEHIFLQGTIKNLMLNDVIVQQDKIAVRIYTDGESAILFQ
jgi:hypothetical protein